MSFCDNGWIDVLNSALSISIIVIGNHPPTLVCSTCFNVMIRPFNIHSTRNFEMWFTSTGYQWYM